MNVRNARVARYTRPVGFTLLEIMLVILIIGILAGVLIFAIGRTPEKAKKESAALLIKQVSGALERYKIDMGDYPSVDDGGLDALVTKPSFSDEKLAEKWGGPYLTKKPVDPWGQELGYEPTDPSDAQAQTLPYKLWSYGPNKQDDSGSGDDIRNEAWVQADAQQQ